MPKRSSLYLSWLLTCLVLAVATGSPCSTANAEGCPTNTDPIATDRPDVTNSSLVVPTGSLQAENGIDWTVRRGSEALAGTNTRLRLGVAHCTEFVLDVPDYVAAFNGPEASGFSNVVVSFKRQLPVPLGFDLSLRPRVSVFRAVRRRSRDAAISRTSNSPGRTRSWKIGKWRVCSRSPGFPTTR